MGNKVTYQTRNEDFETVSKMHKQYLSQISTSTKPEKVKDRVGELREFVRKVDRLATFFSYDGYWEASRKMKICYEIIAYWKAVVKVVTGDSL